MTEAEARELLGYELKKYCNGEYPYFWIGEVIKQNELGFIFQANIYGNGMDPTKDWIKWGVDAKTKNIDFII